MLTKQPTTKQSSKKPQPGVDCDAMLAQIKKGLGTIRKQDNNKNPIQLLEDIETTAIKLVEKIQEYRNDDKTAKIE